MVDIRTAHTAQLDAGTLSRIRAMLDEAFAGSFDDHDWDHTLGGIHALVTDGDELIGHGAVVQRRLLHTGHAWRTGYVEGVAVRADRRREGHASAIMAALEDVIRGAYDLGALSASESAGKLYEGRGWLRWPGPTAVLTPTGIERTPDDDDSTFVLAVDGGAQLRAPAPLTCDWRDGDVW
ncbi:GNAT family N-acetyltransferase [Rhizomonospora bruguierae]|uniref:GNAT family N-acetyltransferase n=1 Tax=Rhizomonospora bruguierae TaxID=1581705 RepID=UPI0020BEAD2A|nr:GNAT family N-acetyltransferase [Micromonospora sp. NBRC 107566]